MEAENIVPIDLDSDIFNNVDTAKQENPAKKTRGSKRSKSNKNVPLKTYIYIDDDDDETPNNHHSTKSNNAVKNSPVKLSKCKRTYPEKCPTKCNPSADNGSECELKSDSKRILQKLWERASSKKKANVKSESDSKDVFNEKESQCGFGHKDEKSKKAPTSNKVENEGKLVLNSFNTNGALVAQTEEAQQMQRLLKRKEAEKLRLLDMEKRQKQRIKEIRDTQQKEKENMNLKEIYRTKVQRDLKKLEMTCYDMASLLRALGILVDDGSYVSSNQIRAAYKRALLRFHPDRASGSDMHQQVEAEEKFKLISRMRDNFI